MEKRVGGLGPAIFALAGLLAGSMAFAQGRPGPPKAGAEHARLGFFVGRWKTEGKLKQSPMGSGGKLTGTNECRWFDGSFAVVCNSESDSPMGKIKGMAILGYSSEEKTYTYYGIDASGMMMTSVPKGQVDGKTWTFSDEATVGGNRVKTRYVVEELSETSARYRWEILPPDGNWMTVAEGTQAKK